MTGTLVGQRCQRCNSMAIPGNLAEHWHCSGPLVSHSAVEPCVYWLFDSPAAALTLGRRSPRRHPGFRKMRWISGILRFFLLCLCSAASMFNVQAVVGDGEGEGKGEQALLGILKTTKKGKRSSRTRALRKARLDSPRYNMPTVKMSRLLTSITIVAGSIDKLQSH